MKQTLINDRNSPALSILSAKNHTFTYTKYRYVLTYSLYTNTRLPVPHSSTSATQKPVLSPGLWTTTVAVVDRIGLIFVGPQSCKAFSSTQSQKWHSAIVSDIYDHTGRQPQT